MWFEFRIDCNLKLDYKSDSIHCLVSPEAHDFLLKSLGENQVDGEDDVPVVVKVSRSERSLTLYRLKRDKRVQRNCVFIPSKTQSPTSVFIRLAPSLPTLSSIHIHAFAEECQAKELVEAIIDKYSSVACAENQDVFCDGIQGVIKDCDPFTVGLWSTQTEVTLSFSASSTSARQMDVDPNLIKYSYDLVASRSLAATEDLIRPLKQICQEQLFPYALKELPNKLACVLANEASAEDLSLSSTVFLNDGKDCGDTFCLLDSYKCSRPATLTCVRTCALPPRSLWMTPPLLQYMGDKFGPNKQWRCRTYSEGTARSRISTSSEAVIAFLNSNAYARLSTAETDEVVKEFFNSPKLLLLDQIVQLPSADFSPPWEGGGLMFKVVSLLGENGVPVESAFVSSVTTVSQNPTLRIPLPPVKQIGSVNQIDIASSVPPFLIPLCEKVTGNLSMVQVFLVTGPAGVGKKSLVKGICLTTGYAMIEADSCLLVGESSGATETKLKQVFANLEESRPCMLVLHNVERLVRNRDGKLDFRTLERLRQEVAALRDGALIFGLCRNVQLVDRRLASIFGQIVQVTDMTAADRESTLRWACQLEEVRLSPRVDLSDLSRKTASFVLGDIAALVRTAQAYSHQRVRCHWADKVVMEAVKTTESDFEGALAKFHELLADSIGAPKVPEVKWEDVGGLETAKREILDIIDMPLKHPELAIAGMHRFGILMYGPPGVGKTLLAKAVATECSLSFLSVKGPELLNMYVGQSEHNIRELFVRAKSAAPCVIFFDELDSLAPNRGKSGDSGGVMDRVVSQLLAELDGLSDAESNVFVIGATNRPDLLDPALLRPGRFDRLVYLGVAKEREEQARIIASLTRKFRFAADFTSQDILDLLPDKPLTGADLYSICSEAVLRSLARTIRTLENDGSEADAEVSGDDFVAAINMFVPSVSEADLAQYESLRQGLK